MSGFKEIPLKELYDDLIMGQSPSSETYNDEGKGLPFVQGNADMKDGVPRIRIHTTDPKKLSQKGDILISVRAPVGDLFKNNLGEIAIGRGLSAVRINNQGLNHYIHYYFSWNKMQFLKLQQGTTFTEIGKREVRNLRVSLPENPAEQTAIATILTKVDNAIEATQKSIKAAEKLKKGLMQNLLTGKLKPNGSWRSEDEFYEDEKFGKVPIGWGVQTINELVDRKTDTIDPLKSKDVHDYVGLEHIAQGEFTRIGKGKSDETLALKVIFEKGDLLYGKLRPYLNKVWRADISGVGSTEFLVFEKNENTNWVYLNFQTKRFLDFTLSMTAGTQHPRASWRDVKRFQIIKPVDSDEAKSIEKKILATEIDKRQKESKIKSLQRLKKSLMQNLLTGKVRLPEEFIMQFEEKEETIEN